MSKENILTEWKPSEGFNILDFRDSMTFPQYDPAPYVMKFGFSGIANPLQLKGVSIDFSGWNIPECQSDTLFSRILISKNGFQDIYYNQPGGTMGQNHSIIQFRKTMVLRPNDMLVITFFPLCPVHMVDLDKIVFLTVLPVPKTTDPPATKKDNPPIHSVSIINAVEPIRDYWYIYATIAGMIILLLLSLLFMTINGRRRKTTL